MAQIEGFDFDKLIGTPTRLRATAAAIAMMMAGEQPSVSAVARIIGVSRQALTKDHKPLTDFVSTIRESWKPSAETPIGKLSDELAAANARARADRVQRLQAERERDRALHHLQLAEATLAAMELDRPPIVSVPFGRGRPLKTP